MNLETPIESNEVMISGINVIANVSISGGSYSINGGAYTSNVGTITNNQKIKVKLNSSSTYSTLVKATLTIGGVSENFEVTTMADNRVAASCGSANGAWFVNKPTTNLCADGSSPSVSGT